MQQFLQSLDMMRNGCIGKFKVDVETLDRIRDGDFDLEPTKDLLVSHPIKYIVYLYLYKLYLIVLYQVHCPTGRHTHQEGGTKCA